MPQPSGNRRTSIGVLFWIAFILLVLVIFLANRSNIEHVLESTGLVEVLRDRFVPERTDPQGTPPAEPAPQRRAPAADEQPRVEPEPPPARPQPRIAPDPPADEPGPRAPAPDPERPHRMMAALYYIRVTDDGRTFPQRVVRPVYYDTSPLTETIRALLAGPNGIELSSGLLNLIPDGTQLISAHVRNGTAFLNFNQAFRFNPLGAEGTVAQLLQIIYSSTEFPTVERVQFLVEGEQIDYLGGDGIYVGEPLGRNAFS